MADEQTSEEKPQSGIVGDNGEVTVPVEVTVTETRDLGRLRRPPFNNPFGPQLSADADAPPSPDEIPRETDVPEPRTSREDPGAANAAINEFRGLTPAPSRFSPPPGPTQRAVEKLVGTTRSVAAAVSERLGKSTQ